MGSAHMELEFDMLSVVGKFVKYVIHSKKKKKKRKKKKENSLFIGCPNSKLVFGLEEF
jgi:hypothetical protein